MKKTIAIAMIVPLLSIAVFCGCANGFDPSETSAAQNSDVDASMNTASNEDNSDVIDAVSFDIDNDGIIEDCAITYGPTSGIFTIVITASVNGTVKYKNTFHIRHCNELMFAEKDGVPQIHTAYFNINGEETESKYHKLYVESNRIVIDDLNENEGYWGDAEWNYDLR